jgi:hypothetical protein
VENLEISPVLWRPTFADLDEIEIVDGPGVIEGPSDWTAEDGVLSQSSNIHGETDTPHSGTFSLGGREPLEDIEISARLRSDSDGAIGVMFRVTPPIALRKRKRMRKHKIITTTDSR